MGKGGREGGEKDFFGFWGRVEGVDEEEDVCSDRCRIGASMKL
jgi:hypothetical protein